MVGCAKLDPAWRGGRKLFPTPIGDLSSRPSEDTEEGSEDTRRFTQPGTRPLPQEIAGASKHRIHEKRAPDGKIAVFGEARRVINAQCEGAGHW